MVVVEAPLQLAEQVRQLAVGGGCSWQLVVVIVVRPAVRWRVQCAVADWLHAVLWGARAAPSCLRDSPARYSAYKRRNVRWSVCCCCWPCCCCPAAAV